MDTFANCIFDKDKRPFEEIFNEVMDDIQEFEDELYVRKTTFFGGLYKCIPFSVSFLLSSFSFYTSLLTEINTEINICRHKNYIFCFRE